jgi:polyisoprenoid-binding protein YceI
MKIILSILAIAAFSLQVSAQKFYTRDGKITFSSNAPMEKIEAINNKVSSVVDVASGDLEFAVLIKSFHFDKALMEEHFNENYMESTKYPKATFKGKITNMKDINLAVSGEYRAAVAGDLTIHGVTKPVETQAILKVGNGAVHAVSDFEVAVADFNIEIPKVVRDNVAKMVQIHVDINYKPMEQ